MELRKIGAIIVTFNRHEMLARCLEYVMKQSYRVDSIYIIDNASSDFTFDYLTERNLIKKNYLECNKILDVSLSSDLNLYYYRLTTNMGGAGGFYQGLKIAHESGRYDAFWMMDDDGYPSEECLKRQLPYLSKYDYVMPVSINIDNHKKLSWATRKQNGEKTTVYEELLNDWGGIMPFIFPFNGSLLSKKIVDEVGYINPKLFIWGDDYEHYYRCLKAGFTPITVLDAEFYHPENKAPTVPAFFGKVDVPYVDSELRFVCLIRNWAFINKSNKRYVALIKTFAAYTWLFIITQKLNIKKYKLFLDSYFDGLMNKFDRHKKYLK